MGGKKIVAVDLWQCCCWNRKKKKCGNWFVAMAEMEEKKSGNWFVAMLLLEWKEKKKKNSANGVAENERENCLDKKNILDSYSKKYTYSYSFHVSVVFLTETVWFMCMWCSFISYSKSILCMICPMKQIMNLDSKYIDSYSQKKKKYIDSYKMKWKKKMIYVHCKKKKKKIVRFLQRFFAVNICL